MLTRGCDGKGRRHSAAAVVACVAILMASTAAPGRAGGASGECIRDWSTAARVVAEHSLMDVGRVIRLVEERGLGRVVQTQLCEVDRKFHYRVVVIDGRGRLTSHVVDAVSTVADAPR
ncbi:MAG: hypothetical protein NW205_10855 [Hyphomicrobiaceae bacterium]|nr:hypothetical protein [Hyphomicrobiaceae bacterium]